MDSDKPPPPRRTASTSSTTTSDLFICFTSRHHSSSMKSSSKSILSPGRAGGREPPISLTASLSRRLRTSRSIKGGASPAMFPTTGKKRGGGFENPEPTSPKVTCIGQVRVKSKKKQAKKLRTLSRRHSTGDVSFRKLEHSRDGFSKSSSLGSNSFGSNQERLPGNRNNQRWVHLPLTICEALRAFGSEFSCLFPCRSSCFSPATEREKEERTSGGRNGSGSCAAVFTRWLVAFPDDGGGGREIKQIVEDEEDDEENIRIRRHVFDDLEIVDGRIEGSKDEARMSICIPPKNALLLMRCRSDPLKMEALANRLWAPTIGQNDEEDEEYVDDEDEIQQITVDLKEFNANEQETNMERSFEVEEEYQEQILETSLEEENQEQILETDVQEEEEENQEQILETDVQEEEITFFGLLFEEIVDQDQDQEIQDNYDMEDAREELFEDEIAEIVTDESNIEKVKGFEYENEEAIPDPFVERSETTEEMVAESKEKENGGLKREGLPECLLLMMCEPKLSMEISKETWVSSKDFIRRPSSRKKPPPPPPPLPVKSTLSQDESKVSATTTTALTRATKSDKHVTAEAPFQPRRSSCSLPAPPSMADMLEQKLVNAVGYEPFVLTRCKSEPMKTAAAKLAPDTCFWKNRKLEPLRRASFGVSKAGLGF